MWIVNKIKTSHLTADRHNDCIYTCAAGKRQTEWIAASAVRQTPELQAPLRFLPEYSSRAHPDTSHANDRKPSISHWISRTPMRSTTSTPGEAGEREMPTGCIPERRARCSWREGWCLRRSGNPDDVGETRPRSKRWWRQLPPDRQPWTETSWTSCSVERKTSARLKARYRERSAAVDRSTCEAELLRRHTADGMSAADKTSSWAKPATATLGWYADACWQMSWWPCTLQLTAGMQRTARVVKATTTTTYNNWWVSE